MRPPGQWIDLVGFGGDSTAHCHRDEPSASRIPNQEGQGASQSQPRPSTTSFAGTVDPRLIGTSATVGDIVDLTLEVSDADEAVIDQASMQGEGGYLLPEEGFFPMSDGEYGLLGDDYESDDRGRRV